MQWNRPNSDAWSFPFPPRRAKTHEAVAPAQKTASINTARFCIWHLPVANQTTEDAMQVLFKAQQRLDEKEKQVEAGPWLMFSSEIQCRKAVGTMAERCDQCAGGAGYDWMHLEDLAQR